MTMKLMLMCFLAVLLSNCKNNHKGEINEQNKERTVINNREERDSLRNIYQFKTTKIDNANSEPYPYSKDSLYIDITSGFENDTLKIFINDSLIYNKNITSNKSIGLADHIVTLKDRKYKSISIQLNDGKIVKAELDLNYNFIDVAYYGYDHSLVLNYSHTQPIYD